MHTIPSGRVRFGAFELDLSTGELRSIEASDPGNKVILREQVFQVLRILLEREGEIVTREAIKERLWANDTVVDFDRGINATFNTLRRALGDSADNPRYIETLTRRGYRLMPDVEYRKSAPGIAPGEAPSTLAYAEARPAPKTKVTRRDYGTSIRRSLEETEPADLTSRGAAIKENSRGPRTYSRPTMPSN